MTEQNGKLLTFTGNTEATVMLLEAGAKLYKQDKKKMTCLHLAAARNHTNVVSLLIAQKVCCLPNHKWIHINNTVKDLLLKLTAILQKAQHCTHYI